MNIPSNLRYTENDEWILVDGNIGTIGITDYAQEQLSDIVFVEIIAEQGETLQKGDVCATVESVKAASDVYLPVSGEIIAVNDEELPDTPEIINTDPYGQAWMLKIELSAPSELDQLMNAESYKLFCEEREQ